MSERLIIRLNSHADDNILWLQYNDKSKEVISSGQLNNAQELDKLSELSKRVKVQVLVSGCDVSYFEVPLPKTNRRQAITAIPFMLEDELAADIDALHFVYSALKSDTQGVYICAKHKIHQWLGWLEQANIVTAELMPDYLAIPVIEGTDLSILQLGDNLLLRTSINKGMTIDSDWLNIALPRLAQDNNELVIAHYDVEVSHHLEPHIWNAQPLILPMEQLANAVVKFPINLLIGEFEQNKQEYNHLKIWRPVAIAASLLILLGGAEQLIRVNQLESQALAYKKQSESIYRQLNPEVKRVLRIKSRMTNELNQLSGGHQDTGLIVMLESLQKAFIAVPKLTPETIKYDHKRQEIRLQAEGESFQQFEKFQKRLSGEYDVTMGAMNNNGGKVNSSLVIKVSS